MFPDRVYSPVRLNDLESIVGELVDDMENLETRVDEVEPRVTDVETGLEEKGRQMRTRKKEGFRRRLGQTRPVRSARNEV